MRWKAIKYLIKGIWITLRSLCRKDYIYNTPFEPIERLAENEYLKFCHWSKEADQLEKDVMNAYRWVCYSENIEQWYLNREIMRLFMERYNRVQRMMYHLSQGFAKKYGRSPTVPSIIEKNGFVRQHKESLKKEPK